MGTKIKAITKLRLERKATGSKCAAYYWGALPPAIVELNVRADFAGWTVIPNSVEVVSQAEYEELRYGQ